MEVMGYVLQVGGYFIGFISGGTVPIVTVPILVYIMEYKSGIT